MAVIIYSFCSIDLSLITVNHNCFDVSIIIMRWLEDNTSFSYADTNFTKWLFFPWGQLEGFFSVLFSHFLLWLCLGRLTSVGWICLKPFNNISNRHRINSFNNSLLSVVHVNNSTMSAEYFSFYLLYLSFIHGKNCSHSLFYSTADQMHAGMHNKTLYFSLFSGYFIYRRK